MMPAQAEPPKSRSSGNADRKIRLLVVSSDLYPPFRVDVTVLFGEELAARGHQIDWILQSEKPASRSYVTEWGGGKVWVGATDPGTSIVNRLRKHFRGIAQDFMLFRLLRAGDYDAIEVKDKFIAGLFAGVAARLYRKKFIYWLSYPFPEEYLLRARDGTARYPMLYLIRGHAFRLMLYRLLMPMADHVFVQSEQMRRDMALEGVPMGKMTPVPMGIRLGTFPETAGPTGREVVPEGVPCVLYLGTLSKVRRLDFLVRVLVRIVEQIPAAKLYVVGRGDDPSDDAFLLAEAKRLGVADSMVMIGQLPQAEALRYVRDADVCVSPFFPTPILNSTSPTKLVEYMAMGKAVVANDHPEQRLVIEQSGAGHCVPYEEVAFAAAVVDLLRDPAKSRAMGKRGRDYAVAFRTYKAIADDVERKLLEVVAEASP